MAESGMMALPREQIAAFCRRRGISELALFGSASRGEARPDSDIDMLVTFAPDTRVTLWDMSEMQDELGAIVGRPVDLVSRSVLRNPFRRRSILRDLTIVYAA